MKIQGIFVSFFFFFLHCVTYIGYLFAPLLLFYSYFFFICKVHNYFIDKIQNGNLIVVLCIIGWVD